MNAQINRRSLLSALPAVAVSACVPAPAVAGGTPVMRLYREFWAHRRWADSADLGDAGIDEANDKAEAMLRQIVAMRPEGPADTVIKFLLVTQDYEALYGNPHREALEAEARALVA